jgi:tetratricopeptide (TPR) repeat protein
MAAAPPSTVSQADDDVAHGLYQAGKSAYEAGRFKEALQFFEQAYQHSPRPAFLFNIGQVADRMRQDDKALTSFKAYLDQVPAAQNRAEVEQRVDALEEAKRHATPQRHRLLWRRQRWL